MVAVSRYLKYLDPECITVFIGPCIAKKGETLNELIKDTPDYALTYGEFVAMLDAKDIEIEPVEEEYQESSLFGKRFAGSGGVAGAVMEVMKELGEDTSDIRLMTCAGGDECKKAMSLLKAGKLNVDFVEGMICHGGCVGGPSKHQAENLVLQAREDLLSKADDRCILANLKNYPMDKFSMHRDGSIQESPLPHVSD
jgi:iron only hydrogenase large subunit-like protein